MTAAEKKEFIKIPSLLVTFGLPIVMAITSSFITARVANARMEQKVEQLVKDTDKLDAEKASQETYELVLQRLDRIENKQDIILEKLK